MHPDPTSPSVADDAASEVYADIAPGSLSVVEAELVVNGRVTDENSSPIPGANILRKGSAVGTTTDSDGRFTINVPDENAVLVVSFIGFTS